MTGAQTASVQASVKIARMACVFFAAALGFHHSRSCSSKQLAR